MRVWEKVGALPVKHVCGDRIVQAVEVRHYDSTMYFLFNQPSDCISDSLDFHPQTTGCDVTYVSFFLICLSAEVCGKAPTTTTSSANKATGKDDVILCLRLILCI